MQANDASASLANRNAGFHTRRRFSGLSQENRRLDRGLASILRTANGRMVLEVFGRWGLPPAEFLDRMKGMKRMDRIAEATVNRVDTEFFEYQPRIPRAEMASSSILFIPFILSGRFFAFGKRPQ
ncbi:MAG: hypothetical protein NT069_05310 [Planctomycetota bacterium]|nr:hypothetical protein [Planctomycetota bacterium]